MDGSRVGCGPHYDCYVAARNGDEDAMRRAWRSIETGASDDEVAVAGDLGAAVEAGDTERVASTLPARVFATEPPDRLDGVVATAVGRLLWTLGYVAAFVLFVRAHSRETVVARLRWAYRAVGVDLRAVESTGGVERTVFRCPYRTVGADRWGERRVCHDVLDRVDDGYVSFLDRHRDVEYDRPRPCAGGACCYSEVTER